MAVIPICIFVNLGMLFGSLKDQPNLKQINARLNKLEAASTSAQQTQERHYSFRCGTYQKVPFEVSPSWKPVVRVDSLSRNVFIDFYSE